jgi:hypothetical protein
MRRRDLAPIQRYARFMTVDDDKSGDEPAKTKTKPEPAQDREARRKAALRANLRRRKQAARSFAPSNAHNSGRDKT